MIGCLAHPTLYVMAMRLMDRPASLITISNAELVSRSPTCALAIIQTMPAPIRTSHANRIPAQIMWLRMNVNRQTVVTGVELIWFAGKCALKTSDKINANQSSMNAIGTNTSESASKASKRSPN